MNRRSAGTSGPWALVIAGVVVLALIIVAGEEDWFSDNTLFGFGLLAVSAGVFGAAYALTNRQLSADAREALITARIKVKDLAEQVKKLNQQLEEAKAKIEAKAREFDEQAKKVQQELTDAKARLETELSERVAGIKQALDNASALISDSSVRAQIDELKKTLDAPVSITATTDFTDPLTTATNEVSALGRTLTNVTDATAKTVLEMENLSVFTDPVKDLPEEHRLVGLWVAAGLTIVLLGFVAATGISITTSGDDSGTTGTGTSVPTGTETSPE